MSKKADNNASHNGMNLGELGTIRDILMGPQIAAIEERISNIESKLQSQISELDKDQKIHADKMEKDILSRISQLETMMNNSSEKMIADIKQQRLDDRKRMAQLLTELTKHYTD